MIDTFYEHYNYKKNIYFFILKFLLIFSVASCYYGRPQMKARVWDAWNSTPACGRSGQQEWPTENLAGPLYLMGPIWSLKGWTVLMMKGKGSNVNVRDLSWAAWKCWKKKKKKLWEYMLLIPKHLMCTVVTTHWWH